MTEVWALPGYDVQALIGFGATGEVWRACELSSGTTVALKRLREDADVAAVESLRREASVLRTLDTPYVVRLRAVLGEGAGTVLVLDHAPGGSLAALLARRGSLDPGEVVTIAAPLAQALAAAHACGIVHGDVTPANVLFTAEGMPLLADLGLARLVGEPVAGADGTAEYVDPAVASGGDPDEAADVWALGAVCHHMLSGTPPHDGDSVDSVLDAARAGERAPLGLLAPSAPRPLVSAIERALQADVALRPDAGAFASALRRSHAAAPVRLTADLPASSAAPDVRPTHPVHRSVPAVPVEEASDPRRRRLLIAMAAAGLLSVAAVLGWVSGRSGPVELASVAAATPAATTAPVRGPSWQTILDALDRARSDAYATSDVGRLVAVYAPASPMLAADRSSIAGLAAHGQTARGVRHTLRTVAVVSEDGHTAVLRTVDVLRPYDVVDRSGNLVQRTASRGDASFVVRLVRTSTGWRLMQVTAA